MNSCIMRITPEMAMDILSRNGNNRPVRQKYVEYLANEMESAFTDAEAIAFRGPK